MKKTIVKNSNMKITLVINEEHKVVNSITMFGQTFDFKTFFVEHKSIQNIIIGMLTNISEQTEDDELRVYILNTIMTMKELLNPAERFGEPTDTKRPVPSIWDKYYIYNSNLEYYYSDNTSTSQY